MNAPHAELNEFVIQLENGVEIRIDKEKRIVTLTPQNVATEAGKGWTVKAGEQAAIQAGNEVSIIAPRINLQGHVVCKSVDGMGQGQAEFVGDVTIRGDQTVTGNTTTNGSSHIDGDSYAGSRSGGKI